MAQYGVKIFKDGRWDGQDDRRIEAKSHLDAVEKVLGPGDLMDRGKPGQLRAQVRLINKPDAVRMFYSPY